MKRASTWLRESWDEMAVYGFTFLGSIWAVIYQMIQSKTTMTDLERVFWGGLSFVVSLFSAWAAENRGILFSRKPDSDTQTVKSGRKKNLISRLIVGFAFGFCIQLSLPFIVPAIGETLGSVLVGLLKMAAGGGQ